MFYFRNEAAEIPSNQRGASLRVFPIKKVQMRHGNEVSWHCKFKSCKFESGKFKSCNEREGAADEVDMKEGRGQRSAGVLFLGREDGAVEVWDLLDRSQEPSMVAPACARAVASLAFSPATASRGASLSRRTLQQLLAVGWAPRCPPLCSPHRYLLLIVIVTISVPCYHYVDVRNPPWRPYP